MKGAAKRVGQLGKGVIHAGLVLAISGVQIFVVNRRFLPKALRPPLWREILLLCCSAFYAFFSFFVIRNFFQQL